ncbi:MAG: TMEM43 family protein [Patescibacteria group bacterium]
MPDQFKEVTRTSYGSKVKSSFGGVLIGLILFVGSFVLLYWNEGRVDISNIAATATQIQADETNTDVEGNLVSAYGELKTEENIGDDYLVEDNYVQLVRTTEMYSWIEEEESETKTETGGSDVTETTYTYDTDWTSDPEDSSDFKYPEEHENPNKSVDDKTVNNNKTYIGNYKIDTTKVDLPSLSEITLNETNTILDAESELVNSYIFIGEGTLSNPEVGDIRISYQALSPGADVTVFGKLDGTNISTYADEDANTLYRVFNSTHEEALATMHTEYVTSMWIFRAVGFIMMWIGLAMFLGPISTILSFIPLLGKAGRGLISIITFVIAAILSILTILISMILQSTVALVIIGIVIVIAVIVVVMAIIKNKK